MFDELDQLLQLTKLVEATSTNSDTEKKEEDLPATVREYDQDGSGKFKTLTTKSPSSTDTQEIDGVPQPRTDGKAFGSSGNPTFTDQHGNPVDGGPLFEEDGPTVDPDATPDAGAQSAEAVQDAMKANGEANDKVGEAAQELEEPMKQLANAESAESDADAGTANDVQANPECKMNPVGRSLKRGLSFSLSEAVGFEPTGKAWTMDEVDEYVKTLWDKDIVKEITRKRDTDYPDVNWKLFNERGDLITIVSLSCGRLWVMRPGHYYSKSLTGWGSPFGNGDKLENLRKIFEEFKVYEYVPKPGHQPKKGETRPFSESVERGMGRNFINKYMFESGSACCARSNPFQLGDAVQVAGIPRIFIVKNNDGNMITTAKPTNCEADFAKGKDGVWPEYCFQCNELSKVGNADLSQADDLAEFNDRDITPSGFNGLTIDPSPMELAQSFARERTMDDVAEDLDEILGAYRSAASGNDKEFSYTKCSPVTTMVYPNGQVTTQCIEGGFQKMF